MYHALYRSLAPPFTYSASGGCFMYSAPASRLLPVSAARRQSMRRTWSVGSGRAGQYYRAHSVRGNNGPRF